MKTRILIAMMGIFLYSARSLDAQGTGTIRGRVTDASNGQPVPSATVSIAGRTQGAVTSANGEYAIAGIAPGSVEVTARRIGFARNQRTVSVTAGAETRVDIALTASVTTLDALVTTGTGGSS